jgi:hypothetical protein
MQRQQSHCASAWMVARLMVQLPLAFVVVFPCVLLSHFLSGFPTSSFGWVWLTYTLCALVGRSFTELVCAFLRTPISCLLMAQGAMIAAATFVGGLIQKEHWPVYMRWIPIIDHFHYAGNIVLHALIRG